MNAAKEVGTKTLYWSGLMPVSKITSGKYTKVEHFDTKVRFEDSFYLFPLYCRSTTELSGSL